jgi:hypothetical protein
MTTQQTNYLKLGCGMFLHFNMSTFIPDADAYGGNGWAPADMKLDTFAPTVDASVLQDNINAWAATAAAAGCGYAYLTAKHHDGFALWPTAYHVPGFAPYSVTQTTWYSSNGNPDIVRMFVTACRTYGIQPGLYFSILDRTFENRDQNCTLNAATQSSSCYTDYMAMISMELTELLSNYGTIVGIWTDGWAWHFTDPYTALNFSTIYGLIKGLQPNTLLLENNHQHTACRSGVTCGTSGSAWVGGGIANSDIAIWEVPWEGFPPRGNTVPVPAEAADVMRWGDTYWFFNSDPAIAHTYSGAYLESPRAFYSAAKILNTRATANYLLDVSPRTDGSLPPDEISNFSGKSTEALYPIDLALSATVTASSNYSGTGPNSVLTDGIFATGTCCLLLFSTGPSDVAPYAEVDLGQTQPVNRVELFNRTDNMTGNTNPGRLRDLTLTLFDASHNEISEISGINAGNNGYGSYVGSGTYSDGPGQLTVSCETVPARYVRVSRMPDSSASTDDDRNTLVLMELAVPTPRMRRVPPRPSR